MSSAVLMQLASPAGARSSPMPDGVRPTLRGERHLVIAGAGLARWSRSMVLRVAARSEKEAMLGGAV